MLSLYRRHRAKCKRSARRADCSCPIWVQGVLGGEPIRKSLDLTNWQAANKRIHEWEMHGKASSVSVREASKRWLSDCEARDLKESSLRKYRHVKAELDAYFGDRLLRTILVDDVRKFRESWKLSGNTTRKRLEHIRSFFKFCLDAGWTDKNPANAVKMPRVQHVPTLPFSKEEWEKIAWALDSYREIHPQSPVIVQKKLRALILLMRYSGLRISDAVALKRDRIDTKGKLFLYTQKTGKPVHLKLAPFVIEAMNDAFDGELFWNGNGTLKSRLTEWQQRLKKIAVIAGIEGRGFAHRLRDSFSVDLLNKGVPIEMVAILLGNTTAIVQKHYAPFVQSRQKALDAYVSSIWA